MFNLLTANKSLPAPIESEPTVPTDETPVVRFGLMVIAVAFGGTLLWSSLAPLAKGVVAHGTVAVDTYRKTVQHLEGGIVSQILVRDGDTVKEGQVLMQLDGVTSMAQRDLLYGQYLAALAQDARLVAERDGKDTIRFPKELEVTDVGSREVAIRRTEEEVFSSRKAALSGQLSIYEQRIKQLDQQINGLRSQANANDEQVKLIDGELEGLTQLFEKGYASKTRLLELQRRRADLLGSRGSLESDMARSNVAIGEARLQIIQLRKTFEEEVAAGLKEAQQRIFDLQDRLTSANDVLDRRDVKAPSDGVIVGSRVHTVGGVVRAGDPLMEVVPVDDRLIVEAMVSPMDIDVMVIGLEAEVRFSALSSRNIPILFGTVTKVAADATTDQQGNRYYIARIEVSEAEMKKLHEQKLIPGMPAEVLVKAGERTLVEYLIKPLTDSFFRAFKEV